MNSKALVVSSALLLVTMLLQAAPARARHFVGLDRFDVACGSSLHLRQASGVPGSGVHTYAFGGACQLRLITTDGPENYAAPPLVASAHWDQASNTYTESLHLLAAATYRNIWTAQPDIHVGTYPETATFKCDVDPVIHRGAHCSLQSQYDNTGWHSRGGPDGDGGHGGDQVDGFAWSANHNRPLLLGLASATQAASLSRNSKRPPINCDGLKLVSVRDLPNRIRSYHFDGTCELYHTADGSGGLRLTHILLTGTWNAPGQGAQESFTIAAPDNEGGGFYRIADYNCTADPFVHGNVQCSLEKPLGKIAPVYDPITDIRARHPIAEGKTTPAQVAKLIGPKRGPSRFNRGAVAASAHAGNLHAASVHLPSTMHRMSPSGMHLHASNGGAHPVSVRAGTAMRMPAANVRVVKTRVVVDPACHDTHKLIVVVASIRNEGGPLGAHKWELYAMEGGGAGLASGGVWVRPLAPKAKADVAIPVMVMNSRIAQLPGTHRLTLISQGGGHKDWTKLTPVTLPKGLCQRTLRFNRSNLPTTKLNPQPEPPSARQRTALPAVQMHRKGGG